MTVNSWLWGTFRSDTAHLTSFPCAELVLCSASSPTPNCSSLFAKYQNASVSGLVTVVAGYRYVRSFNSWVDACVYSMGSPKLTGVPFDDACRYMDWPLTAPLLSIEILSLMNLSDAKFSSKARTLGLGPALMIVSVYDGELVVTVDLTPRWLCWLVSMASF